LLNAANEEAVAAFLEGRLSFLKIADTIAAVLDRIPLTSLPDLAAVMAADDAARRLASELMGTT
jgi:1-deoxy-D-xylulose-5-phosphate reductoisomerase